MPEIPGDHPVHLLIQQQLRLMSQHLALLAAIDQVESEGFCAASWQPEIVALASPLAVDGATYVLNISLSITAPIDIVAPRLAPKLLSLRGQVLAALEREGPAAGAA